MTGPPGPRRVRRRTVLAGAVALIPGAACTARTGDPPLPTPSGPPLLRGRVLDARAFGVRADGTSDDAGALARALAAAAADPPATVALPAGVLRLRIGEPLAPPPGTTVAGEPGRTTLRLEPAVPGAEVVGFRLAGPDIALDGLVLERAAPAPTVLVRVGDAAQVALSRLVLLGHREIWTSYCHGIQTGTGSAGVTGLVVRDGVVAGCEYGLFQTNASPAVNVGVEVRGCTFARNTETCLEFNSPRGVFRGVRVDGCTFRGLDSDDAPGFAVGLAHCADVEVTRSTMAGFHAEAVHVEDHSEDVLVADNVMSACGLVDYAHVQIIGGSRRVTVRGNQFDASMNTHPIAVVSALAGGDDVTPGGRPPGPPADVTVTGNTMTCSRPVRAVSYDDVAGGLVADNRITRPGADAADTVRVRGGTGITVRDNSVTT